MARNNLVTREAQSYFNRLGIKYANMLDFISGGDSYDATELLLVRTLELLPDDMMEVVEEVEYGTSGDYLTEDGRLSVKSYVSEGWHVETYMTDLNFTNNAAFVRNPFVKSAGIVDLIIARNESTAHYPFGEDHRSAATYLTLGLVQTVPKERYRNIDPEFLNKLQEVSLFIPEKNISRHRTAMHIMAEQLRQRNSDFREFTQWPRNDYQN